MTDQQLLENYRSGDQYAFTQLVNRHWPAMMNYLKGRFYALVDLEDVAQFAFLKLHENCDTIWPGTSLKPWLYTVARNRAWALLRKSALPCVDYDLRLIPERESDHLDPEEIEHLHTCVETLPKIYGEVIKARYFEGLSQIATGKLVHVRHGTVKSRVSKGLELLRAERILC